MQSIWKNVLLAGVIALLAACSLTRDLLPNAEFNALMVDADSATQEGRWEQALDKLERAAVLRPGDLDVKLKQGLVYQLSGKLAQAHNTYQQIIDAAPQAGSRYAETVRTARTNQAKLGFSRPQPAQDTPAPVAVKPPPPPVATTAPLAAPDAPLDQQEIAAPAPTAVEETPAAPSDDAAADVARQQAEITERIQLWLVAWQEQRLADYFACYAPDFSGDQSSHARWRARRTTVIGAARNPDIRISELRIERIDEHHAVASFEQRYRADGYADAGRKTLKLEKTGRDWLIVDERFAR